MKIKIKLSIKELEVLLTMVGSCTATHPKATEGGKLIASVLIELYRRGYAKQYLVVNNKPVSFSLTMPECYALSMVLPRLVIPEDDALSNAVRYSVLNSIQPKMP